MIGASDADKSEAVETEDEVIEVDPDAVAELEPLEDADQQGTPHLSTAALLALTKGNTRRLTGTTKSKKDAFHCPFMATFLPRAGQRRS